MLVYLWLIKQRWHLTLLMRAKYFLGGMLQRNLTPFYVFTKRKFINGFMFSAWNLFSAKKKIKITEFTRLNTPTHGSSPGQSDLHQIDPDTPGSIGSTDLQTEAHILRRIYTHALSRSQIESPFLQRYVCPHFHRAFYRLWREHLHRAIKPAWHLNAAALHLHTPGRGGGTQQINKSWFQHTSHFISNLSKAIRAKGLLLKVLRATFSRQKMRRVWKEILIIAPLEEPYRKKSPKIITWDQFNPNSTKESIKWT